MQTKTKKRQLASSVASALVLASLTLAGCSSPEKEPQPSGTPAGNGEKGASETNKPGNDKQNGTQIVAPGSLTLRVGIQDSYYAPASLANNLPVFQQIEQKTGVKLQWEVTPPDQFKQVMQLKLASGKDLPDLIQMPNGASDMVKYGSEGLLLPLEDLIDKHAPNIKKLFEKDPNIVKSLKSPDGHIYGLPTLNYSPQMTTMIIRKDWLDRLNLKAPETIDEWLTVLRAFKEKDPNGNQKADEIPLSVSGPLGVLPLFGNAFGLHLSESRDWWADANGKVSYEWIDDKMKDLLAFLNTLYKEGLLDPGYPTTQGDKESANINNNLAGVFYKHMGNIPIHEGVLKQSGINSAKLVGVAPPAGKDEKRYLLGNSLASIFVSVNKSVKDPVATIKWLDYVFASEEGQRYMLAGIEGVTYTMENGKIKLMESFLKPAAGVDPGRAVGTESVLPHILTYEFFEAYWSASNPELWAQTKELQKMVVPPYPQIIDSPDEQRSVSRLSGDTTTYRNEMLLKFITGKESLDNFGKYKETLKSMGIDEWGKIEQQKYDRVSKK
ncbi:extracellular solute-binding protein [Paenibacillus contaminans]|uniref:extracellular solute-binding protein n=1 Tax=Paenibacillus contaminans TaxID=450362 RepID=UPI001314B506|nr:extracellular solute-binding protein [Paenibacillus contaminans]